MRSVSDPNFNLLGNTRLKPVAMLRLLAECQRRTEEDAAIATRGRVLSDILMEYLPRVEGENDLLPGSKAPRPSKKKKNRKPAQRRRKPQLSVADDTRLSA